MSSQAPKPEKFDAYHRWLGIPPHQQPPDHYQLLGVQRFEADADVIETAADRQSAHVRTYASGQHGKLASKLLNQIAAARICLLKQETKAEYDTRLRAHLNKKKQAAQAPTKSDAKQPPVVDIEVTRPVTKRVRAARGQRTNLRLWIAAAAVLILAVGVSSAALLFMGDDPQPSAQQSSDPPAKAQQPVVESTNNGRNQNSQTQPQVTPPVQPPNNGAGDTSSSDSDANDNATTEVANNEVANNNTSTSTAPPEQDSEPPIVAPPPSQPIEATASTEQSKPPAQVDEAQEPVTEIVTEATINMDKEGAILLEIPNIESLPEDAGELTLEILDVSGFETEARRDINYAALGNRIFLDAPKEEADVELTFHFLRNRTIKFSATAGSAGIQPVDLSRLKQTQELTKKNLQDNQNALAGAAQAQAVAQSALQRALNMSRSHPGKPAAVDAAQTALRNANSRISSLLRIKERLEHRNKALPYYEKVYDRLNKATVQIRVFLAPEDDS